MSAKVPRVARSMAAVYLMLLFVICGIMHFDDGSHWLVTLFLFGPRWAVALPLCFLVPLTLVCRARLTPIYLLHGAVIVFPILGFEVCLIGSEPSPPASLRVMSCNLGGGSVQSDEIVQRVRRGRIQVLMLQECSSTVASAVFQRLGWNHQQAGGIALGSEFELAAPRVLARHPPSRYNAVAAVACEIQWQSVDTATGADSGNTAWIVGVHLPTFRPALRAARQFESDAGRKFRAVASEYRDLTDRLHAEVQSLRGPTIVGGDFNVPVESRFYREYWRDYTNAHSQAGIGLGYTKYTRYHGIRIDHVLTGRHWNADSASVGRGFGGDHRPVTATFSLIEPKQTGNQWASMNPDPRTQLPNDLP